MSSEKTDKTEQAWRHRSPPEAPNGRLTIGFLCEQLTNEYSANVWSGVRDAAWKHGANLICFSGGLLHDPRRFNVQANILYDLVGKETLDGLLLWGAQLAHFTTLEALKTFCNRYRSLPVVNIGLVLEGIPSLLVDNYQGMHDVVTHLIEVHGYRRIAYICGPGDSPEALDRYRGYADALAEHGASLDPTLVVGRSEFIHISRSADQGPGAIGVGILLDDRKLRPRVDFEALVGYDDGTCWWASNALQARGFRVPADVAMAGFDDAQLSRYIKPPITTARQPLYGLGWGGTEILLAWLRGEEVPEQVVLPMKVIVRQSCGCEDQVVAVAGEAAEGRSDCPASREDLSAALSGKRERVVADMVGELGDSEEVARRAGQVLDSFIAELEGNAPGAFLRALDDMMSQVMATDRESPTGLRQDGAAWQEVVSALRRHLLPCFDNETLSRAETLCQQARVLVGEVAWRKLANQTLQAELQAIVLRDIGSGLITTFDVEELMGVLAKELPRLGIPGAYLSLYEDPQLHTTYPQPIPEWSRLMLAYDNADASRPEWVDLDADARRFRTRQLVPEGLWPQTRQYSFIVESLYFREHQLGFALFEVGPREGMVYAALREDISSALQGALLMHERMRAEKALEEAYTVVEGQVKERTAELQQEIAERRRAEEKIRQLNAELEHRVVERTAQLEAAVRELEAFSYSVSHDLRAPLRAIDGYTRILAEDYGPSLDAEGKRVCTVISDNTRRMGQLIDDLLAFSRLSRAEMQLFPIDMEALAEAAFHQLTTPASRTRIDFRLGALPPAMGDPTLIGQVWLNLLSNAIKFSSGREQAVVEVGCQAGEGESIYYVRDNGAGFDMRYTEKLFGVFQRLHSEREFEGTGVGLAIVQRAIYRHGGRVWGEGKVDQGATFFFTLPHKGD